MHTFLRLIASETPAKSPHKNHVLVWERVLICNRAHLLCRHGNYLKSAYVFLSLWLFKSGTCGRTAERAHIWLAPCARPERIVPGNLFRPGTARTADKHSHTFAPLGKFLTPFGDLFATCAGESCERVYLCVGCCCGKWFMKIVSPPQFDGYIVRNINYCGACSRALGSVMGMAK